MNDLWFYLKSGEDGEVDVFRVDRTLLRALQAKFGRVAVEKELRKIHLHMLKRPSARWSRAGALRGIEAWMKRSMGAAAPKANARRIMERFRADYGRRFSPDDPHVWLNEWQQSFGAQPAALIEAVLDSLGTSHPQWPPTRPEFAQLVAARARIQPSAPAERHTPIKPEVADEINRLGRSLRAAGQGRGPQ